ncbi:hypothetical protein GCM10009839_04930 [Catenulispora yoronensis]|uniref:Lipoprotein n=1 Tax=Catenulispora yoronensis TaxID=450799 RepID=A0ABN2TM93_9ACTN
MKITLSPASRHRPSRNRIGAPVRTRSVLVAAAVAGTALTAAGCAAGPGAATLQIQPNFAAGSAGDVQALNMVVVVDPASGAAQVTGTVVNNGDQATSVTAITLNGKSVPLTGSALTVAPHGALNLATGSKVVLANSGSKAGHTSPVSLTLAGGAAITVAAQTEPNTGVYEQYKPSATS